jgi:hypothetical protein
VCLFCYSSRRRTQEEGGGEKGEEEEEVSLFETTMPYNSVDENLHIEGVDPSLLLTHEKYLNKKNYYLETEKTIPYNSFDATIPYNSFDEKLCNPSSLLEQQGGDKKKNCYVETEKTLPYNSFDSTKIDITTGATNTHNDLLVISQDYSSSSLSQNQQSPRVIPNSPIHDDGDDYDYSRLLSPILSPIGSSSFSSNTTKQDYPDDDDDDDDDNDDNGSPSWPTLAKPPPPPPQQQRISPTVIVSTQKYIAMNESIKQHTLSKNPTMRTV